MFSTRNNQKVVISFSWPWISSRPNLDLFTDTTTVAPVSFLPCSKKAKGVIGWSTCHFSTKFSLYIHTYPHFRYCDDIHPNLRMNDSGWALLSYQEYALSACDPWAEHRTQASFGTCVEWFAQSLDTIAGFRQLRAGTWSKYVVPGPCCSLGALGMSEQHAIRYRRFLLHVKQGHVGNPSSLTGAQPGDDSLEIDDNIWIQW